MSPTTKKPQEKPASALKKTMTEETSPAKSSVPKASSKKGLLNKKTHSIPEADRFRMVSEAAYFIAERRGFTSGNCEEDWCQAERIVESSFS